MNFSFRRKSKISSIFTTSKVYCACALKVYDFFNRSGSFFTSRRHMKESVLGRFVTALISLELTSC